MQENIDFAITALYGLFHWKGLGRYKDYCSEDGFSTPGEAETDAQTFLADLELPELE